MPASPPEGEEFPEGETHANFIGETALNNTESNITISTTTNSSLFGPKGLLLPKVGSVCQQWMLNLTNSVINNNNSQRNIALASNNEVGVTNPGKISSVEIGPEGEHNSD